MQHYVHSFSIEDAFCWFFWLARLTSARRRRFTFTYLSTVLKGSLLDFFLSNLDHTHQITKLEVLLQLNRSFEVRLMPSVEKVVFSLVLTEKFGFSVLVRCCFLLFFAMQIKSKKRVFCLFCQFCEMFHVDFCGKWSFSVK